MLLSEYRTKTKTKAFFCIDKTGQKNGLYVSRYSNGQLEIKCTYINGKKDGPYEEYLEDGRLLERCIYKNNKPLYGEKAEAYKIHWEKSHNFNQLQQDFNRLLEEKNKTISLKRHFLVFFRKQKIKTR